MSIGLRGLHRDVRPAAELAMDIANAYGLTPVITSTFRDWQEQQKLRSNFERCVRRGLFPSPPNCKFPANRPGDSSHNFGLGFDSWVPAPQMAFWAFVRRWVGFRVPTNDLIHAEVDGWRQFVVPFGSP